MKKIILLILYTSFLTSCSCLRVFRGIVVDEHTQIPINKAKVSVLNKGYELLVETDSIGNFEVFVRNGYGCPRIKIAIEKDGYQILETKQPNNQERTLLKMKPVK
ncbi:hypothetical protein [Paenimyroides ceti]